MTSRNKALGSSLENRVVERAKAKGLKAQKQPGSGVYRDFPSDCVVDTTLVECKVRAAEVDAKGARSFRVDLEWWKGVRESADKIGMEGAAVVVNPKYSKCPLVLIDLDFFLEILSRVKEKQPDG